MSRAAEKKIKQERSGGCRGREEGVSPSRAVSGEGLVEQNLGGADSADLEGESTRPAKLGTFWGRSPLEEGEQGVWKALCITFLKSADAMCPTRVCVYSCVCV